MSTAPRNRKSTRETLWLALHFPHLGLDLVTRGHDRTADQAVALSDNDPRRPCIHDCTPAAARAGIQPGLPVNAALGLLESLHMVPRDLRAEHAALERLAAWCYRYSSEACILAKRSGLLLEVGASRVLFGTPEVLARTVRDGLRRLGYQVRTGSAPTPECAWLVTRHSWHIPCSKQIRARIAGLPLQDLYLDRADREALGRMGFRSIGEILRLPRKALARRQGPAVAAYLDRLLGAQPDPQTAWHPPMEFVSQIDLVPEVIHSQALLFPLKRLVSELCGVLRAGDRAIQQLRVHLALDHRGHGADHARLGLTFQQALRSESHILLLLRERLERLVLSAPVRQVRVTTGPLLPFEAGQGGIFRDDPNLAGQAVAPLIERLQARLGRQAVRGLKGCDDHRPEHSWAVRELDESADCAALPHRPLWLLPKPQRCHIEDFEVLAGPERIEAGWWDGHDCRRDYFVVRDRHGSTLWAFREYKPEPGWYLQGLFS